MFGESVVVSFFLQSVDPENGNSNHRKLDGGSDNESSSKGSSSNAASGNIFEISDSCDKGSDTRSSCSIAAIQTKSMHMQEGPGPPQMEYTNVLKETDLELEKHGAYVAKAATSSMYKKRKAKDNLTEIEIKLTLSIHKNAVSTDEVREENISNDGPPYRKGDIDSVRNKEGESVSPRLLDGHDGSSVPSKVIIGTEISENCRFWGLEIDHPENRLHECEKADAKRNTCDSGSLPSLELSLRSQLKSQNGKDFQENHVLKHSEASAFSRYGNARRRLSCPSSSSSSFCMRTNELCNSNVQINSTNDNSKSPSPLIDLPTTSQVNGREDSVDCQCQPSSGSNKEGACPSYVPSGEDVCHPSTGKPLCHQLQYGVGPFPVPIGALPFQSFWGGYGATFQPHLHPQPSVSLSGSTALPKELVVVSPNPSVEIGNQANNMPQTFNCHPIYGNHNPPQFLHWMDQRTDVESAPSRVLLTTSGEKVYQGRNSNSGVTVASERKGGNEGMDVAANAGIALERVRGDGIQNCNVNWLDCDRSRREAALTKFRLKRKDRCFEKKVRYHNRKKLAEQRPRLKGQFVCQAVAESTSLATESD
ncbi:hypothetical protein AQUCO_00900717v1 [Aquilegia coerulea]|uniref:CCT domain-containing protein n=1 Tax=Aquilegia coerulea TaxID=218851 RepID=A0A2G5EF23_AQUCA|nr:hypothetical protein AQUCO_00900717v1 [Aquilegia coerulea]